MDIPYLFLNIKERVQILFQGIKHMKYGNEYLMKKQERIETAQKRKKLIDHWLKNESKIR